MTLTEQGPLAVTQIPAPQGWYASTGKRAFDLLIVAPLVLLVTPVLALTWVALRLELGRGVILAQNRIGRDGAVFSMYKFRTMERSRRRSVAGDRQGPDRRDGHKKATDPRHTTLGRTLRKFSIDELPQLLNVLRGDMSLVGPRPQLAEVASATFRAHPRHLVRPGLTGAFQVSTLRSGGDLDAGLDLDADYVANLTFRSDLAVLLATFAALVRGTGT
jgi:lipopolysaccharide/colanic/teichoic acid biosynthesis glycosyltransferase